MIGFIQHEQRAGRNIVDQILHGICFPAGAHGIIRVGKINQAGFFLLGKGQERGGVFMVIQVRRGDEPSAETCNVKIIGGVSAVGICDGDAGFNKKPDGKTKEAIDAFADGDVFDTDFVVLGYAFAEIIDFRIAVFPGLMGGLLHGGNYLGRGAEDAFIGADAGAKRNTGAPQDGFGADERNAGGKAVNEGGKTGHGSILFFEYGI